MEVRYFVTLRSQQPRRGRVSEYRVNLGTTRHLIKKKIRYL